MSGPFGIPGIQALSTPSRSSRSRWSRTDATVARWFGTTTPMRMGSATGGEVAQGLRLLGGDVDAVGRDDHAAGPAGRARDREHDHLVVGVGLTLEAEDTVDLDVVETGGRGDRAADRAHES